MLKEVNDGLLMALQSLWQVMVLVQVRFSMMLMENMVVTKECIAYKTFVLSIRDCSSIT